MSHLGGCFKGPRAGGTNGGDEDVGGGGRVLKGDRMSWTLRCLDPEIHQRTE